LMVICGKTVPQPAQRCKKCQSDHKELEGRT
jgi:hypothetical protein